MIFNVLNDRLYVSVDILVSAKENLQNNNINKIYIKLLIQIKSETKLTLFIKKLQAFLIDYFDSVEEYMKTKHK